MNSSHAATDALVDLTAIEAASERLAGTAVVTPLLESPLLNARTGGRVLIKPECLQRTGSFKFRGAYNTISSLTPAEQAAGVIAYSSGNHAQGVASAAQLLGVKATIIMPRDAPAIKIANTKFYGAEIVHYDRYSESREDMAAQRADDTGAVLIRPYDDPRIIAGQGTTGLEIAQQCQAIGAVPDAALFCCGGGGLTAGSAIAVNAHFPDAALYAVEPEDFDDTARSFASGRRETIREDARSICDALLTQSPGEMTFAIMRERLTGVLTVSDDEALAAMKAAFSDLKLVAEPGGAVALAAVLSGKIDTKGRTVVAVISGGNVDAATYQRCLSA